MKNESYVSPTLKEDQKHIEKAKKANDISSLDAVWKKPHDFLQLLWYTWVVWLILLLNGYISQTNLIDSRRYGEITISQAASIKH